VFCLFIGQELAKYCLGRADTTEQQTFLSIYRGNGNTFRDTTKWLWDQNRYHCSIFTQTQRHRGRAARAMPKVLRSVGFRAERRVTFEAKEFPLCEIQKRGGT
jgi:hypothetical protein